jgi:DNA (cytosine-5)-methyltransferase 1
VPDEPIPNVGRRYGFVNVGSLCSGIGGFDLGLERAGMRTAWFCESDPFCRRVLERHHPGVPISWDIKALEQPPHVDVIAAGFPCPVSSSAARGRNVGEWLWPECARIVRVVRPRYVIVENVEGLLYAGRGFGEVLGDLAASGFDAVWRVLRASDFGAPHHRARVWLVGYAHRDGEPDLTLDDEASGLSELHSSVREWPDPPARLGMDDGIPDRLDRVRRLGNALVPEIAEWIGRRIIAYEEERLAA